METLLLDDSVCCKLCGKVFESPVLLSCAHSVCLKCAEASLSLQRLTYPMNFSHNIACPTCNSSTNIPATEEITNYLKPNYDLKDIIDKLRKDSEKNGGLEKTDDSEIGIASDHLKSGVHYWEVKIDKVSKAFCIGIVENGKITNVNNRLGSDQFGWSYYSDSDISYKYHNGEYPAYGEVVKTGSVVGVLVDCDNSTLTFFHNGKNLGKAFDLPKGGVFCPAVTIYYHGQDQFTFIPNAKIPQ